MAGNKEIHTFPKGISPKGNVIPWLEFELTTYDIAVQHINHYVMMTAPKFLVMSYEL